MPKIKLELKVPEDECSYCILFDGDYRRCLLFGCYPPYNYETSNFERCEQCKQAEVKE